MKVITQLLIAILWLASVMDLQAQAPGAVTGPVKRTCATPVPGAEWDSWFNGLVHQEELKMATQKGSAATYTIPVIVHVIHGGTAVGTYPNLTQAQINSQIAALNADFAGNGHKVSQVPPAYAPDVADCEIVFSMAQLDPGGKGLAEPGIERIDWHSISGTANPLTPASSAAFQTFFDDSIKPATIWDPTRYFNIWISDVKSTLDLLGYATFPAGSGLSGVTFGVGSAQTDGVWIWGKAFGTTGVLHPTYNYGRTATHEIGHWLGLRHIWGDASCGSDYCADTPPQQTSNFQCPVFPKVSCSNGPDGDMFMNFMDYCDDDCLSMFTWNQRSRMHTALQNGTFRKNLTASSGTLCNLPAQAPVASFLMPASACTNTGVIIDNQSAGLPAPACIWSAAPAQGVVINQSGSTDNAIITFSAPGSFSITLQASNSAGTSVNTQVIDVMDCGIPAGLARHGSQLGLKLVPNPARGVVKIEGVFIGHEPVRLTLYNLLGENVSTSNFSAGDEISVDVGNYPDGIYFAEIVQGRARDLKKLVVGH